MSRLKLQKDLGGSHIPLVEEQLIDSDHTTLLLLYTAIFSKTLLQKCKIIKDKVVVAMGLFRKIDGRHEKRTKTARALLLRRS